MLSLGTSVLLKSLKKIELWDYFFAYAYAYATTTTHHNMTHDCSWEASAVLSRSLPLVQLSLWFHCY